MKKLLRLKKHTNKSGKR